MPASVNSPKPIRPATKRISLGLTNGEVRNAAGACWVIGQAAIPKSGAELHRGIKEHIAFCNGTCLHAALRIAWSQWLGCPRWFRDVIKGFAAAHPDISVRTYDFTAGELRDAVICDEVDLILTTRYSAAYLPGAWIKTALAEEPMYMLRSAEATAERLELLPHMAAFAGEEDESSVRARVSQEYQRLGLSLHTLKTFDDMGSVCINLRLGGGVTFGIGVWPVAEKTAFVLEPLDRTATVTFCKPLTKAGSPADLFERYLLDYTEVRA